MSISTIGELLWIALSVFIVIFLLACLGAISAVGAAWVLTSLTELIFEQALMIGSASSILIIGFARYYLDLGVIMLIFSTLFMTPVLTLVYALAAWPFASFSPLSYWEALILTTAIGLSISYNMIITYKKRTSNMLQNGEESDELLRKILSELGNS